MCKTEFAKPTVTSRRPKLLRQNLWPISDREIFLYWSIYNGHELGPKLMDRNIVYIVYTVFFMIPDRPRIFQNPLEHRALVKKHINYKGITANKSFFWGFLTIQINGPDLFSDFALIVLSLSFYINPINPHSIPRLLSLSQKILPSEDSHSSSSSSSSCLFSQTLNLSVFLFDVCYVKIHVCACDGSKYTPRD